MYKLFFSVVFFSVSIFSSENNKDVSEFSSTLTVDLSRLSSDEVFLLERDLREQLYASDSTISALKKGLFELSMAFLASRDKRLTAEVISKIADKDKAMARSVSEYTDLRVLSQEASTAAIIQEIIDRHS